MLTCSGKESALAGRYIRVEHRFFSYLTARDFDSNADQKYAPQGRTEQNSTVQSRSCSCAFLRITGRLKQNTTFAMNNRRM